MALKGLLYNHNGDDDDGGYQCLSMTGTSSMLPCMLPCTIDSSSDEAVDRLTLNTEKERCRTVIDDNR